MAGSFDHTAKVWDAATRRELLTLKGHSDTVSGVAFSSDGKRLATGSWDDTAKLWLSEAPEAEAMVEQGVRP
jgi:WD40 repeat protein